MPLPRFDLNLLIALDVLLREKNVTRAAERLYLSQPAASAALNRLRALLQDPLLVRAGRDMELTPRARALVEPVRAALLQIESALGAEAQFSPATARREFVLVLSEEAVPELLPAIVRMLAAEAPGIRCHTELVSPPASRDSTRVMPILDCVSTMRASIRRAPGRRRCGRRGCDRCAGSRPWTAHIRPWASHCRSMSTSPCRRPSGCPAITAARPRNWRDCCSAWM